MSEHYCMYKDGMCELDVDEAYQQGRADAIDEFVKWAYVHGIDFSFMGKIKDDGTSDVPERLQKIKNDFWEQLKGAENG